jgi:CBS domain containing-hemolysin-like protein
LVISALCSLTEAALYAVRLPYIHQLVESGNPAGTRLLRFKREPGQPITAILILNTVANTAGAALAGAQASLLFGEAALLWFTVVFTITVLVAAEIMPKVLGVTYCRRIAKVAATPLALTIRAMFPLVWLMQILMRGLKPRRPLLVAPEEDVRQLAILSAHEGSILPVEAELVENVLRLNEVSAGDLMTPCPKVVDLPADLTLREVGDLAHAWAHTRIPLRRETGTQRWIGFVLRRDLLMNLVQDRFDISLGSLARPLPFVSVRTHGYDLLKEFLSRHMHLLGVADEHGRAVGIVSLEDVLESLLGKEIEDEPHTTPRRQSDPESRLT